MAGRPSDPVRDQAIVADYRRLQSAKAVGKIHGITGQTVYYVLGKNGIPTFTKMEKRQARVSDEAIIALYKETKSGIEVAKRLGVADQSVYRVLAESGIQLREDKANNQRRLSDEQIKEIIERYRAGVSGNRLAEDYNCAVWTILAALAKAGEQIRGRKRIDDTQIAEARRLYESGMGAEKIGDILGYSGVHILRLLSKACPEIVRTKDIVGPGGAHWLGGRTKDGHGYSWVWVPDDDPMKCMAGKTKYVLEHRLVMARKIGRPLLPTETVHHINGKRDDNRPENLELRQGKHGKHVVMCCLDCGSRNIGHVGLSDGAIPL